MDFLFINTLDRARHGRQLCDHGHLLCLSCSLQLPSRLLRALCQLSNRSSKLLQEYDGRNVSTLYRTSLSTMPVKALKSILTRI